MDNKYVVFVDEDLIAGSMQMAAAQAAGQAEFVPEQLTVTQQLALRRSILGGLASAIKDGQAGGAAAFGATANSAITTLVNTAASLPTPPEDDGTRVLEGANAIIVDGDEVDVDALRQVVGLTVYPNLELRLPSPVTVQAVATPPEKWHLTKVGLPVEGSDGEGILVGVLDTGIDAAHPEFVGKTIHFQEFNAAGMKIAGGPRDAGEHGTHVCSIIAGRTAGVAPGASLAVAAVLTHADAFGRMSGTLVQIVNGFDWLVKTMFRDGNPGVDVMNASLGGAGFNTYLQQPVRSAVQLGVPLIAAIGNSGRSGAGQHGSPGNYPEVMGVGASDVSDAVADFSDWGTGAPPTGPRYPVPDLCAPGVLVYAAKPGGAFQRMSGTSMATPVVTGVAARRMSADQTLVGKPAALFNELRRKLAPCTTGPLGNLGGAGRIIA